MIGVLTHHWAKEGRVEEAAALLDGNGQAQSRAPGLRGALQPRLQVRPHEAVEPRRMGERGDIRRLEGQPRASHGYGRRRRPVVTAPLSPSGSRSPPGF